MVEIRDLQNDDSFDELIQLSKEFFREYESHHEDFFQIDQINDSDIVGYFAKWIDNENGAAFIALIDGRIVGYITVYIQTQAPYWNVKKVGDISGLMVHKAYRHQGIATQLLDRVKAFLASKGVRYFILFTAVANRGALEFYARNGLQPLYTTMVGEISPSYFGVRNFNFVTRPSHTS